MIFQPGFLILYIKPGPTHSSSRLG